VETAKMPTTDEWIKKMWCLHTVEFNSATKENEILSVASKWMQLESFIFSIVRLRRPKSHVLLHMQITDLKQMQ
jgi:hypothetical protein